MCPSEPSDSLTTTPLTRAVIIVHFHYSKQSKLPDWFKRPRPTAYGGEHRLTTSPSCISLWCMFLPGTLSGKLSRYHLPPRPALPPLVSFFFLGEKTEKSNLVTKSMDLTPNYLGSNHGSAPYCMNNLGYINLSNLVYYLCHRDDNAYPTEF